jgi:broad specificity polyphosphatase/5'/3'-nucleotidase SurE
MAMRVLLTNDDGIEADGLQALRRALRELEGIDLVTIAPDGNRSAIGRGITTRRPLVVERVDFGDGTHGFATDGTPVDCVRLAALGLLEDVPLPPSTLLNVNVPAGEPAGVEVCRLGKRIYRDQLKAHGAAPDGRRQYWIYGEEPSFEDEPGTDLAAVHAGRIAVSPLHLDLTHHDGIGPLSLSDLDRLLAPAAAEIEE